MSTKRERLVRGGRIRLAREIQKIQHQLLVTFEADADVDQVGVAMIGQGYVVSMQAGNASFGQVAYRMKLAREIFGMPKGVGFARQYHRGESELAKEIREKMLPVVRAMIMDKLVKGRRHLRAKVAATPQE